MSRSGSDPPAVHHPTSGSAGVRRGCVGVVPDGVRAARGLAEWQRITGADRRPDGWRGDRLASLLRVRRSLLRHADREQLLSRPGHALIAAETGLTTKTIQRRIDDMHLLGWLVTTEVGTTERIRAGRLRGAKDPHAGNRAQEYRLTVPTAVADEGDPPVSKTCAHDQDHDRRDQHERTNCPPFPSSVRSEGKWGSSRRKARRPGNARARDQRYAGGSARPRAAGKTPPRRPARSPAWRTRLGEVTAVWQTLPRELTRRLADHEADRLAAAIAAELTHRSVHELADRIAANWSHWRYKLAADLVKSPIAVAHRIIRRGFNDCPDVRCENGWQLDTDRPCNACQDQAQRVLADRYAAQAPPQATQRRASRGNHSASYDHPVCGAASAPHLALPPPTLNPAATERGATLARRLLRVRSPAEREKIINEAGAAA